VTLSKPAYEGELLTVRAAPAAGGGDAGLELTCVNDEGVELARMRAGLPGARSQPDIRASLQPALSAAERLEATWDLMRIGEAFPALEWQPTARENREWCDDVGDDLPLYREGLAPFLHPGLVLRQANNVFRNRFVLPAWIHTASRITFHEPLRVGPACEVRAIPEEKWARKGHEFVRLYVAIRTGGSVAAEILHTAIFRPRRSDQGATAA